MSFFYGDEKNNDYRRIPFIRCPDTPDPEPENIKIKYYDKKENDNRIKNLDLIPLDITNSISNEWIKYFIDKDILETINSKLWNIYYQGYKSGMDVYPLAEDAMSVFEKPISEIKCVVIGESPYPGWDNENNKPIANGKSFSTYSKKLPVSQEVMRLSIAEYFKTVSSKNKETPYDLQGWIDQGVFLLNHVNFLYVYKGNNQECIPKSIFDIPHSWITITEQICKDISEKRKCFFVLIGNKAKELGRHVTKKIELYHPSRRSSKSEEFKIEKFLDVGENILWNRL